MNTLTKPLENMSILSTLPGPLQSLAINRRERSLGPGTALATGLPPVRRVQVAEAQPEPEYTELRAFALLVSAACYLSLNPAGDLEATLEAVHMLQDLSLELRDGGLELVGDATGKAEDAIWEAARERWRRRKSVEAAIQFVKAQRAVPAARAASRWSRLWAGWRTVPRVQVF